MSVTNGYCSLAELKTRLSISDTVDDTALELGIESASRAIDGWCSRKFWLDNSTSAQTFRLDRGVYAPGVIWIEDFDPGTPPTVKSDDDADGTYETTWTAGTDYVLEPLNPSFYESTPQNQIRLLGSRFIRPSWRGRAQLQVTAKWGWPAVPTAVKHACEIVAVDLFKSKDAPFGVAGAAEFGVLRIRSDIAGQAKMLLTPYRRIEGIG